MAFNLADLFEVVAQKIPAREAVVAGDGRLTYGELDARAERFAAHLTATGIVPGEHVGIYAWNRLEWVEAMLGCFKARVVPINVNYRYVLRELEHVVQDADLVALVYERAFTPLVDAVRAGGQAGTLRHLVVLEDGTDKKEIPGPRDAWDYEEVLAATLVSSVAPERSADDLYIIYTGGTTGMPKGVMWRQEDIFFAALGGGGWGRPPIRTPEELADRIPEEDGKMSTLVLGPLMHGNAQWALWNALLVGGTGILSTQRHYDPEGIWTVVAREHPLVIALVGDAMARPLAEALERFPGRFDVSSVKAVVSGGAMLSTAVRAELEAQLPGALVLDRFGASESGAQGAVVEGGTGTNGGPRFVMGEDTAVLDDDLRPLAPGDGRVGRLGRRGHVPLGYYKDPVKTAETFLTDGDGVRWAVPGDLATVEADGTITVFGRGSASINSGGEKIFPEEVEAALKTHPDVFAAVVVAVPDEHYGQRVAAVVRPRVGAKPSLEDLQTHCRSLLAGYKVPRALQLVDEVPLSAAGKPDLQAARALFPASF
jgi:fatty-acyl-CoA synthase